VTPPGCARCRRTTARERRQIAAFSARLACLPAVAGAKAGTRSGGAIVLTDAIAPPPRGAAALGAWGRTWRTRVE
jgi:hypothetical protein